MSRIKVLLTAGNYKILGDLRNIIKTDRELHIVAEANNAYVARDKILESHPDVMVLCDELPRMKGIAFLAKLMPQYPLPTVVICEPQREKAAYDAGAAGVIGCTDSQPQPPGLLIEKIRSAAPGIRRERPVSYIAQPPKRSQYGIHVIAMGASTGGTEAMYQVVKSFKKDIPGIVMVQHMPEGFTEMYAQRLNNECEVEAKEAQTGDVVRPGRILLAPAGSRQMRLVRVGGQYQVECRQGPKVSGHCPSVDVLFESVARVAGKDAIGVLMTGMGHDGADGLLKMRQAGAYTIGQDEQTSVVYGMPKVAYEMGAVSYQVPLQQIANKVYYILERKV